MSSVTGNHAMNFFYLLQGNFKNLPFHSLITRSSSRICLISQFIRCIKDGDSEEWTRTYYEALDQTFITQKYRGPFPNTFYGMEASSDV